jgi:hypothetical protein
MAQAGLPRRACDGDARGAGQVIGYMHDPDMHDPYIMTDRPTSPSVTEAIDSLIGFRWNIKLFRVCSLEGTQPVWVIIRLYVRGMNKEGI